MKKKSVVKVIIIVILLVLMTPRPYYYKDGGSVEYKAILYSIKNYHSFALDGGFDTGIEIKILGITVYENTTFDY